jgi:hypothetical protein
MALHLSICIPWPRGRRSLIPIMERNILLNKLQSNVAAAELDWCVQYCSNVRRGSMTTHDSFFPGQSHYLNCNVRTLSLRQTACTSNRRFRCLSPHYPRSYRLLPHLHLRCCSATRNAERPTSAFSHCSKKVLRGPWYVIGLRMSLRIPQTESERPGR